jgi:hypothetical protein
VIGMVIVRERIRRRPPADAPPRPAAPGSSGPLRHLAGRAALRPVGRTAALRAALRPVGRTAVRAA